MKNAQTNPRPFVKKGLLLLLLLLPFSFLSAQEGFTAPITAQGEILIFEGRVLDRAGNPVPEAVVEIWQTDDRGIYDHPGDRNVYSRDQGFQGFGSARTDDRGWYNFRTLLPGIYGSRPRHIHVKIKLEGRVLLISQIYFAKDGETRGVGGSPQGLYMDLAEIEGSAANRTTFQGVFDYVLNTGTPGDLPLTGRQSEGPFYPVVDPSLLDNDLVSVD